VLTGEMCLSTEKVLACVNVNLKLLVFMRPLQEITSAAPEAFMRPLQQITSAAIEAFSCQCVSARHVCILNPRDMCVFRFQACIRHYSMRLVAIGRGNAC
jgi:hypothetical protein